jgi:putative redox protein
MTAQLYARRSGWRLDGVEMALSTHKIHARDCEICESRDEATVDILEAEAVFRIHLTTAQRDRLAKIVDWCPVRRSLTSETVTRTQVIR